MRVDVLRCDEETELHIWSRHQATPREVEEAVFHAGLTLRGRGKGVYEVYGRTEAGRFLMVAVRHLGRGEARVITARDMSHAERRRYEKLGAH
ncbi:MAG: BrnT family toxin [Elusimicrobiota bacterium]